MAAVKKLLFGAAWALALTSSVTAEDWSGWWGGLSVGGAQTRFDDIPDGSQFCATQTSAGATASCSVGKHFSEIRTWQELNGSTVETYHVNNAGSVSQIINSDVSPPEVGGATLISMHNGSQNLQLTLSDLQSPTETSFARGVTALNIFDFGTVPDLSTAAVAVGAHLRRDWQLANGFVFGLEGELSFLSGETDHWSASSEATFTDLQLFATESLSVSPEALGSLRIRVGRPSGHFLPYVTAGLGVGAFETQLSKTFEVSGGSFFITDNQTDSKVELGGVAGGGVSVMLSDKVALTGEGLYYLFNDLTLNDGQSVGVDSWSAMLKLSMKLN